MDGRDVGADRRDRPPARPGPAGRAARRTAPKRSSRSSGEIVPEIDLEAQRVPSSPTAARELLRARATSRTRLSSHEARRRHDLPRVPGAAERLAGRQGARPRPAGRAGPRPARLDARPAPHRRRHPVRRRPRHGHEARAVGRGAGRGPRLGRGRRASPCWWCPRPAAGPSPRHWPWSWPASPGWSSPRHATRASTAGDRGVRQPAGRREVSIGDYVLAGGEAPVLVIVEAVARLLPGVLGNAESHRDDSFAPGADGRPAGGPGLHQAAEWRGRGMPEVLLSGHHGRSPAGAATRRSRRTARTGPT